MADRPAGYTEFWQHYLRDHADPRSRALHYIGSILAVLAVLELVHTGDWRWLPAAILAGYGFAWFGHFVIERNRPATFSHPVWSLASDYRMLALWTMGRLGSHLAKAFGDRRAP